MTQRSDIVCTAIVGLCVLAVGWVAGEHIGRTSVPNYEKAVESEARAAVMNDALRKLYEMAGCTNSRSNPK